jgi:sec-independent protein translocase protein TatB
MFDLSWSELLVVVVVAILVIGPKDMPVVARTVGRWIGKIKRMGQDFMKMIEEAGEETGLKEVARDVEWEGSKVTRLIDLEGKEQIAYDVEDVEKTLGVRMRPVPKKKKPAAKPRKRKAAP